MIASYRWTHEWNHMSWSEGPAAAWHCATFIRWTLKMAVSWWQHYKCCPEFSIGMLKNSIIHIVQSILALVLIPSGCLCRLTGPQPHGLRYVVEWKRRHLQLFLVRLRSAGVRLDNMSTAGEVMHYFHEVCSFVGLFSTSHLVRVFSRRKQSSSHDMPWLVNSHIEVFLVAVV